MVVGCRALIRRADVTPQSSANNAAIYSEPDLVPKGRPGLSRATGFKRKPNSKRGKEKRFERQRSEVRSFPGAGGVELPEGGGRVVFGLGVMTSLPGADSFGVFGQRRPFSWLWRRSNDVRVPNETAGRAVEKTQRFHYWRRRRARASWEELFGCRPFKRSAPFFLNACRRPVG